MSNSLLNKSFTFQETRSIQAYVQEVVNPIVADAQALGAAVAALEVRIQALENNSAAPPAAKAKVVKE